MSNFKTVWIIDEFGCWKLDTLGLSNQEAEERKNELIKMGFDENYISITGIDSEDPSGCEDDYGDFDDEDDCYDEADYIEYDYKINYPRDDV